MAEPAVEPKVFDFLDDHLNSVESGKFDTATAVKRDTPDRRLLRDLLPAALRE